MDNDEIYEFHQIQAGNWSVFKLLFERYQQSLYVYALGYTKQAALAEDIVQDTFVSFWENRQKIVLKSSISGYLFSSVKHYCIDQKLHEKVQEKYERYVLEHQSKTGKETMDEADVYEQLQSLINSLPPKCKEVFLLACLEKMSYAEIAERCDISVNTVKTHVKKAYKLLKSTLSIKPSLLVIINILLS